MAKICLLDIETGYGMLTVGNAVCIGNPWRFGLSLLYC